MDFFFQNARHFDKDSEKLSKEGQFVWRQRIFVKTFDGTVRAAESAIDNESQKEYEGKNITTYGLFCLLCNTCLIHGLCFSAKSLITRSLSV